MKMSVLLCLLLWSLVEVHSQTEFPYFFFMGEILPNHAYVNLTLVGSADSGSDNVQCHTDLVTCCNNRRGSHRGDWYFPNGDRLQFTIGNDDIFEARDEQRLDLRRRNNANSPSGIYRCDIPTNDTHDIQDVSVRETVYVGLYASGGDITISGGMTFTVVSELTHQFTLTCISTGGPATTVTWTRESVTVTEGTETVLDDPVTAQYTHTLTVTGRLGGLYTCTVSNNKPSLDSAELNVQAPSPPSNVSVSQNGLGSILVSWISGDPTVTGYIIYYQQQQQQQQQGEGEGDVGQRLSLTAGANDTSATITGLIAVATYSISIVATSNTLSSTVTTTPDVTIDPGTISLTSSPSPPVMAGDTVTLTCSVTLPDGVTGTPDFQWEGPGGVTPTPADSTTSGQTVSSDLTLSEISTSQAGQYTCTATLGGSNTTTINIIIQSEDLFFQLRFIDILTSCSEFVNDDRTAKLDGITNAILNQLITSCPECGITSVIIDMQLFRCFPESPSHVTYRARLAGTSETDSGLFISLIEEWVRGGADIGVTGLLMTVDSKCSVEISSFSEGECSITTLDPTPSTDSSSSSAITTGGIIGSLVAVILIVAISIIVVVLMLKFRRGEPRKIKYEVNCPVNTQRDSVIATTSNTAYEMTKLVGEMSACDYEVVGVASDPVDEMPSAPPSHQPLPAIPLTETTPTGGDVGVASQEEDDVYDNMPGDQ